MKHVDSGERCLVYHGDGKGQCIKCAQCGEWLTREKFKTTECVEIIATVKWSWNNGDPIITNADDRPLQ